MFLLALFANLTIVKLICLVPHLHTPMYFFLCNLSIQDIVYVSAILPKTLAIIITDDTHISFPECITQMFFFVFCVVTEFFLLPSMAYDRYVAICIPLRYTLIMNRKVCAFLSSASWLTSLTNSLVYSLLISNLSFCKSHDINHFFCDMRTLLELSCSDKKYIFNGIFVEGVFFGLLPFALLITSYVYIISAILKIHIKAGRYKAFSSCSSHLTIVIIFYGTSLILYMKPESDNSQAQDKLISMLYIALVPMLNPLVYSLRNQEVLRALRKVTGIQK
ncbi:olfactory receptor 1G1-like [Discoglossus pictus]